MKLAVISGGGWICKISCISVAVEGECRFTITAKWELRAPEENCFRAVVVFGFDIPILRSSCPRSLLDCRFVSLLSTYLLLAVSREFEARARRRLCLAPMSKCGTLTCRKEWWDIEHTLVATNVRVPKCAKKASGILNSTDLYLCLLFWKPSRSVFTEANILPGINEGV